MKVKSVTIEGFHNVDRKTYEFNNINYLIGKNAVGKTTVLQALQLALLGYIPGTNKRTSDIFKHSNSHTMAVTATLDNDGSSVVIRRIWTGTKSGINSMCDVTPADFDISNILSDIELPIFNFNEFLGMTSNKLKDWFINFLPKSEFSLDWNKELVESLPDYMKENLAVLELCNSEVSKIERCGKSGVDQIRWANDYFKQGLSFKKSEMDRITSTIQSMIHYDDIDESLSSGDIQSKINVCYSKKLAHDSAVRSNLSNSEINNQLSSLKMECPAETCVDDDRYNSLSSRYDKICKDINNYLSKDYRALISDIISQCSDIQSEIKLREKVLSSNGICPFTDEKCNSISELVKKYKDEVSSLKADMNKKLAEKDALEVERNEDNAKFMSMEDNKTKIVSEMNVLREKYERKQGLTRQIVSVDEIALKDNTDYDSEIRKLQELLAQVEANKKYNVMIDKLTKQKFNLQSELEAYKCWVNLTGVNGLQNSNEGYNPFEYLKDNMNIRIKQFFGEEASAEFKLESKANSFSFGLSRNGNYVPYDLLSSGEKCLYSLGLMMSIVECSNSPLKLIMVDDLFDHLDDEKIGKLFDSLYTVEDINVDDIQMIFAGVKYPTGTSVNPNNFIIEVN